MVYLAILRPHQWLKNLLIFVPLFLSQQYRDGASLLASIVAFIIFCLVASAIYIINDIIDIEHDKKHPSKKHRPFAAGKLPWQHGALVVMLLGFLATILVVANGFSLAFVAVILFYVLLALAYSFQLKKILMLDIIVLSCFYSLRILLGIVAVEVDISFWLLAFSVFLFFSLSLVKRYSDLTLSAAALGRAYSKADKPLLSIFGVTSGYISILIFFLYIENSNSINEHYANPYFLWPCGFIILYSLSRLWLLAQRGKIKEDPVLFVAHDKPSWLALAIMAGLFYLAIG